MSSFIPLSLQIALPLLVGLAATAHLSRATRRLLLDLCGTEDRADFWVRTTGILLTGVPLVLALLFGHAGNAAPLATALSEIVRQTLTLSLLGLLLGVAVLARLIWKQVPSPAATPAGDASCAS